MQRDRANRERESEDRYASQKMSVKNRVLAGVLAVIMLVSLLPAGVFAAGESTVVIAASDLQNSTGHDAGVATVNSILAKIPYTSADGFLFAGDYDHGYTDSANGLAKLKTAVSAAYPQMGEANMVFVKGNHDDASTAGLSSSGANDPASGKYGVFVINESDYMWHNDNEAKVKQTANALKSYLAAKRTAGFTAPIFVISHLPLHYSMRTRNDGDGQYANYIFDELNAAGNAGLNIIFLFGHDHSHGWDDYLGGSAVYLAKGDKINIAQASKTTFKEETLAFTYMNAGYVGYYEERNNGSETDLTMTAFEITDTQVTVNRYSTDGVHALKSKGVTNSYKSETGYSPNTTVYNSPQTIALNKSIDTDQSEEIEKPVPGTGDGTAAAKKLEQVYELTAGESYIIVNNRNGTVLTGTVSDSRLQLSGTPSVDTSHLWYYDDNGNLRYGGSNGSYMTIGDETAGVGSSNRVDTVSRNNDGTTFSISRSSYYLYSSRGSSTARGRTDNSSDGNKWQFWRIVGNTVDTELNGWVEITAPSGGKTEYTYTLTDTITAGKEYAIVAANNPVAMMNSGRSSFDSETVTISADGKTLTADVELDLWIFSNNKDSGTVSNDGRYLRYSNNRENFRLSTDNDNKATMGIKRSDAGYYRISYRPNNTTYYFGYTDGEWGKNSSSSTTVRLYSYTDSVTTGATKGLYYKISGNKSYPVPYGTTEANALAAVMAGITGYKYEASSDPEPSVAGTAVEDGELTFTMSDSYDGTTPGEYAVTIYKDGKELGVVKVVVPAAPAYTVKDVTVSPSEGRVLLNCNPTTTATGSKLRVNLNDGEYYYLEDVTVGMLTHADGTPVDTTVAGVYENLVLTYVDIAGTTHTIQNYKLTVWAGNPYPEFPKEGSIRTNKTATGIDLRTTGVAAVELSVTGVPVKTGIDVVVIMDTSSSMNSNRTTEGITRLQAAQNSLNKLITMLQEPDADGQQRDIRVAIADFNGFYYDRNSRYYLDANDHLTGTSIRTNNNSAAKIYTGTESTLNISAFEKVHDVGAITLNYTSGTNYDYALDAAYQLAEASRADDPTRDLYVVFMSDGAPFQYNYFSSQSEASNWNNWLTGTYADLNAVDAETSSSYYYFYNGPGNPHRMAEAIKGDRNRMYTVIRKDANTTATAASHQQYMTQLPGMGATVYSIGFCLTADKQVTLDSIKYVVDSIATPSVDNSYSYNVNSANELTGAFEKISSDIIYAATNARFVDQMSDSVDIQLKQFKTSSGVINPTMEVVAYDIYTWSDFDAGRCAENEIGVRKGTKKDIEKVTFSSDGTAAESDLLTGNILGSDGVIRAKSFFYNTTDTPVKINTQNDGEYMLPGETFYWNIGTVREAELALRYYVSLTGAAAGELEAGNYPTNKDATLYYTNYLGQDNREKAALPPAVAWKSGSIHYAFYLVNEDGQIVTNQTTGETGSFANRVAVTAPTFHSEVKLNDEESVDALSLAAKGVVPEGYVPYDATAVYHVGVKGDTTGSWNIEYSEDVQSTYVTGFLGDAYSNEKSTNNDPTKGDVLTQHANYDYTHTTVWFAVVWKIAAVPDKVVVDYGLPVDIHVLGNDMFGDNGELVAIAPVSAKPNDNITHTSTLVDGFDDELTLTYGNAAVRDNMIRYTPRAMAMGAAEQLAYAVRYNGTENSGYYYGTLDIIPATSIYYEDSFVEFENGAGAEWSVLGSAASGALQDEDRPGKFSLATYDANNLYGTDSVNEGRLTYSLGGARTVTVDLDDSASSPTASFTFTGSGFDIIGLTSTETGFVQAEVFAVKNGVAEQDLTTKLTLDTYYNNGTLYQVPIITSGDALGYGTWKVVLTPIYVPMLNHALLNNEQNPSTLDALLAGSYTFVMDAVRIYDPANHLRGNPSDLIRSAYVADNEGWPSYFELRTQLIQKKDFNANVSEDKVPGIIFIEQKYEVHNNKAGVEKYENFGPNNEIYLAPGQAIAFFLGADRVGAGGDDKPSELGAAWDAANVASVQLGMKSADGNPVTVKVFDATKSGEYTENQVLDTCTEMYYDITSLAGKTVIIANKGTSGLLSVTKVKVTHKEDPDQPGALAAPFVVSRAIAAEALAAMNGDAGVFTPEKLELSLCNKTALEKGDKAKLRIVASGDVSRVEVNGAQFTRFVEELGTGDHIWNIEKKMKKVGEYTFSVVAYNADGTASRTYELPVSVTEGK